MKKMRLSEAIREGGKHFKQGRGYMLYIFNDSPRVCALGAAYYATFGTLPKMFAISSEDLWDAYPELLKEFPGYEHHNLQSLIMKWNDNDGRTFDEIADRIAAKGY